MLVLAAHTLTPQHVSAFVSSLWSGSRKKITKHTTRRWAVIFLLYGLHAQQAMPNACNLVNETTIHMTAIPERKVIHHHHHRLRRSLLRFRLRLTADALTDGIIFIFIWRRPIRTSVSVRSCGFSCVSCVYLVSVLTVFIGVHTIVDLRRALLAPQQLLLGLAFLHLRSAVNMHVQLANAASQSLARVSCRVQGQTNIYERNIRVRCGANGEWETHLDITYVHYAGRKMDVRPCVWIVTRVTRSLAVVTHSHTNTHMNYNVMCLIRMHIISARVSCGKSVPFTGGNANVSFCPVARSMITTVCMLCTKRTMFSPEMRRLALRTQLVVCCGFACSRIWATLNYV